MARERLQAVIDEYNDDSAIAPKEQWLDLPIVFTHLQWELPGHFPEFSTNSLFWTPENLKTKSESKTEMNRNGQYHSFAIQKL